MRIVKLSNNKEIEIRSLTVGEINSEKGKELKLSYLGPKDFSIETFDDHANFFVECVVEGSKSSFTPKELNEIVVAVIAETWGDQAEEKNFEKSGQKAQTKEKKKPVKLAESVRVKEVS